MRTPNSECIICQKEFYRRPFELNKVAFCCCKDCRGEAYKKYPNTNSMKNLEIGHLLEGNHLEGIPKSKESNIKRSASHIVWCKENPDKVKARGEKTRGKNHYRWNGGSSKLNVSIRQMTENRKWMDAVRARDKKCKHCKSTNELESHHIISLVSLISKYQIKNRNDARLCNELWDIDNGITLCRMCHYKLENRTYDN